MYTSHKLKIKITFPRNDPKQSSNENSLTPMGYRTAGIATLYERTVSVTVQKLIQVFLS